MADLQKINKELEKLQVTEDESMFSDSAQNGYSSGVPGLESQVSEEHQVRQRRSSGQRDVRAESPAGSLHGSAPTPSPRQARNNKVRFHVACSLLVSPSENNLHPLND